MIFWQIMYLVALVVLVYAIVLQPLLEWMRRCVARRWIRRAMKVLEYNIEIGTHETQCLCGVFQDTRPSGIIFLWGCSYDTVLHNVIGFDYHRLAEHYGTTMAKREGMFSTKLKEIGSGFIDRCVVGGRMSALLFFTSGDLLQGSGCRLDGWFLYCGGSFGQQEYLF